MLENMINVISKTCIYENCNIQSRFNLPNEKQGLYCNTHKLENMINVKSKQCLFEDCNIRPIFNLPEEKTGLYCNKHKLEDMVNVIDRTCLFEDCKIRPKFNLPDKKMGIYCVAHKLENMINIEHKYIKRCIHENCIHYPLYNYKHIKTPLYCKKHMLNEMINVFTKRCKAEHCDVIISHNEKYSGYCIRCFIYTFPDEKISKNYKVKETHVKEFLEETFTNIKFINDKKISGGCSRRRPDFYLDCLTHCIIT